MRTERYENEIARLREELADVGQQSEMAIDRLNRSQTAEESASSVTALDAAVMMESNHVLRQQKEQLERSLINQTDELEELGDQLGKLQATVAELAEEKAVLLKVRGDVEEERNRWKDRCTKLVERAEQMDPEQYKIAW